MKITIIGKRDQMGTTPSIRLKGLSGIRYDFVWDKESRHYAYEPKNQTECDDIFRTQGKIYRTMFFSVCMDEETKEEVPYNDPTDEHFDSSKESPIVKRKPAKRNAKKKQAVEETV